MTIKKAKTLRELYQMIEADQPRFLDAPLSFMIESPTSNRFETVALDHDLWMLPRRLGTKEADSLNIHLMLHHHSLTRRKT